MVRLHERIDAHVKDIKKRTFKELELGYICDEQYNEVCRCLNKIQKISEQAKLKSEGKEEVEQNESKEKGSGSLAY